MRVKKKRLFQTITAVLLVIFLFQLPVSAEDKHSLWKIETETNTVYFLGSIHMLKKECYPLAPVIQEAYNDAQTVVFEVNIDSSQSSRVQQQIMVKAMSQDGKSLQERLDPEIYKRAAQEIKEAGADISRFSMFEPWFFSISLMAMKIQQLGFDPSYGIDYHFFDLSKRDGKQIESLETVDFQVTLFDELSHEDQENLIQQTLDEIDMLEEELEKMIDFWEKGDAEQLADMVLGSFKDYPHIYDRFLIERNRNWISKIETLLQNDTTSLIITGTAHLLGEEGVLSLLEQKGYTIEQL